VRGGFAAGFGADPAWWMALVIALGLLAAIELIFRTVQRAVMLAGLWTQCDGHYLQVWQALERLPEMEEVLARMGRLDEGEDEGNESREDESHPNGDDFVCREGVDVAQVPIYDQHGEADGGRGERKMWKKWIACALGR
jgi:hypothetical protein